MPPPKKKAKENSFSKSNKQEQQPSTSSTPSNKNSLSKIKTEVSEETEVCVSYQQFFSDNGLKIKFKKFFPLVFASFIIKSKIRATKNG